MRKHLYLSEESPVRNEVNTSRFNAAKLQEMTADYMRNLQTSETHRRDSLAPQTPQNLS